MSPERTPPTEPSHRETLMQRLKELCAPGTSDERKDAIEAELSERWDQMLRGHNRRREPGED